MAVDLEALYQQSPAGFLPAPIRLGQIVSSTDAATANWNAAIAFLAVFEAPGYTFGRWHQPEGQMGYYEYSPDVLAFIETLSTASVTVDFAWGPWQPYALRYWEEPSRLDRARLRTLRKLLTLHLRKDRFVEGHFAEMLESGHITAILRRAAYLVGRA